MCIKKDNKYLNDIFFRWFCHFDDDNYVNVPRLLKLLDNYNPREDWYLGRPSIPAPLEISRQGSEAAKRSVSYKKQTVTIIPFLYFPMSENFNPNSFNLYIIIYKSPHGNGYSVIVCGLEYIGCYHWRN